jgi:hypothetical protein
MGCANEKALLPQTDFNSKKNKGGQVSAGSTILLRQQVPLQSPATQSVLLRVDGAASRFSAGQSTVAHVAEHVTLPITVPLSQVYVNDPSVTTNPDRHCTWQVDPLVSAADATLAQVPREPLIGPGGGVWHSANSTAAYSPCMSRHCGHVSPSIA